MVRAKIDIILKGYVFSAILRAWNARYGESYTNMWTAVRFRVCTHSAVCWNVLHILGK